MKKKRVKNITIISLSITALVMLSGMIYTFIIQPNQYEYYIELGRKYLSEGKYDEATLAFNKAISIEERMRGSLFNVIKEEIAEIIDSVNGEDDKSDSSNDKSGSNNDKSDYSNGKVDSNNDISDSNKNEKEDKKKPPQITASNKITSVGKEIDLLSNVTAKDSENKDISKYVLITKNDVDFNKVGDYKVTYSVLDEEGLRADKDIVVTVKEATKKANTAPKINASDKTTTVGKQLNLLDGVTASDEEDGNLTRYVIISSNNVNFNKVGDYHVTYAVLDSGGIRTEKKITVKVKEKANEAPVIHASDKTITVGNKVNLLSGVKATDKEDGDLTQYVTIASSNVDFDRVGTYKVTYAVLDRGGITTRKQITVTVKSPNNNTAPVIHASDKTIAVGNRVNLLSGVSATDKEDGDLTQYVTIYSSNVDFDKVGTYKVTYAVLDRGGITTYKHVTVTVK